MLSMSDRMLNLSMRLTVVGLTAGMALATFVVAYQGLYAVIVGQLEAGAGRVAGAMGLAAATGLLIRYRGDLLDQRY